MDNQYNPNMNNMPNITLNKDMLCADVEKKEKVWRFTTIVLAIIIIIFIVIVWYGYTIAESLQ